MMDRLVLGCDSAGLTLVEDLAERRGELFVVETDEGRVEQLRNAGVAAEVGDITDSETLSSMEFEPDIVLVLGADSGTNRAVTPVARSVFPDAYLIGYVGKDATQSDRQSIAADAETVIDPGDLLLEHLESITQNGNYTRLHQLRAMLRSMDGTLGIFTHDNPDPDAIASGVALAAVAERFDVDVEVCYYGDISHQENRAFVNLLDLDLRNLDQDEEVAYEHFALVDHSGPGINDQLPADTPIDIVMDHHPLKGPIDAEFVDVRSAVGATSTQLVDYIRGYEVAIDTAIATALLYGIRIDTRDFAHEITTADFEAAAYLLPKADVEVLGRIESPSVSPDTLDIVASAIRNRTVRGQVLSSCTGMIQNRDALAQAADRLLNMEDVRVTVVYGYRDGTIYLSGRARGVELELGEALRAAFGEIGSAGGHSNMAGAQISMGLFDVVDEEAESDVTEMVERVVEQRLYEVLDPDTIEE